MPSVLVTGAARGIGRVAALRLASAGWDVLAGVRRSEDGEALSAEGGMWREADSALEESVATLSPGHRELYDRHIDGFRQTIPRSQRMASPVDTVAATIERALTARRPRARYVVGTGPRIQGILAQLTPTPARDALLRTATGVPRRR